MESLVERCEAQVLFTESLAVILQALDEILHLLHLDTLLVASVLGGHAVLKLPAHQLLFRREVVQVGTLSDRAAVS